MNILCISLDIDVDIVLNIKSSSDGKSGEISYYYENGEYHLTNSLESSISYNITVDSPSNGPYQVFIIHDFIDLTWIPALIALVTILPLFFSLIALLEEDNEFKRSISFTLLLNSLLWFIYAAFGMATYMPGMLSEYFYKI